MDIGTVAGLILASVSVVGAILAGGDIGAFIDVPSVMVVGGGLTGVTLIKWPLDGVLSLPKYFLKSIFFSPADPKSMIEEIGKLAEIFFIFFNLK